MSGVYGPAPATERDITLAWRATEAAAEKAAASGDAEAWAAASSAFAAFTAANRSAERAVNDQEAGQ